MEAQRLLHQPLASADASTLAPHVEEAPNFDGVDLLRNGSAPAAETSRALKGFYALTVSLEVFAVVSLVLFLPILLEQVAREHGFLAPDHTLPCPPSSSSRPHVPLDGRTGKSEPARCAVRLLGGWLDTASFSMLTYSASVALQAFTVISLGSRADDGLSFAPPRVVARLLNVRDNQCILDDGCSSCLPCSEPERRWPSSSCRRPPSCGLLRASSRLVVS